MVINTFHVTGLFLYPLKTSENQRFLMFSEGIERDQWHEMGWHNINLEKKTEKEILTEGLLPPYYRH